MRSDSDFYVQLSTDALSVLDRIKVVLASRKAEPKLIEAINYVLSSHGKMLRPVFFLRAVRMFGGSIGERELDFAVAIELLHNYSLVHDDLPCMDNDDLRRGKPTCHKMFGEAMAVLVGDALLNMAYEVMLAWAGDELSAKAAQAIAQAAGSEGMIAGQVGDIHLAAGGGDILKVYKNKTAQLFFASIEAARILCKASQQNNFGLYFGMAFQLCDDITEFEAQKQSDEVDFVTLNGIDAARKARDEYIALASQQLQKIQGNKRFFDEALKFALQKN